MSGLTQTFPNGTEDLKDHTPVDGMSKLSISSQAIHADDILNNNQDVAPPMHVSTTFRYNKNPDKLVPAFPANVRHLRC
jgi:hypothetical protein